MRVEASPEQVEDAYAAVRDDPAWTESCRLIEAGRPPSEMFRMLAVRPDILRGMRGLSETVYPGGLLERALKERVIVAVKPGYLPARANLEELDPRALVVLRLGGAPLTLAGRVVDEARTPISGVVVWYRATRPFGTEMMPLVEDTFAMMERTIE